MIGKSEFPEAIMPNAVQPQSVDQNNVAAPQSSAIEHFLEVIQTQSQIEDQVEALVAEARREIEETQRKRDMEGKPEDQEGRSSSSRNGNGSQQVQSISTQLS
jgi:hypothetical protein